ncbi:alpha/beta fold hydrolase [Kribbella sp. NPDC003557]|uniref:alpha/beta fold hydrolase n=1 Tax=Kribbella sp. NPDC003557 TaxID=3154449 RepID=UPI00339DC084
MADILVLGAGLNGLATATLLARDGHRITVLERDPAEPRGDNDELWTSWERRGVNQFNQLHFMLPRWSATMTTELPEVVAELESRGGNRWNSVRALPESVTGGTLPGDERFDTVTARRPVVEAALAAVAARTPGVTVRRGTRVTELLAEHRPDAPPHVTGVRTASGDAWHADLVVDASGRRTSVPGMLEAVGARRPHEEREAAGFVYYCRHFRARDGERPVVTGLPLQHLHGVSVLTLPGDGDTWGVGFVTSSRDRALRGLRDEAAWSRAIALVPGMDSWTAGVPLTDVQVIAGIEDCYRRYVVDGRAVATGIVAVGDAWACTNPSLGRGASIGLLHAVLLRDVLRSAPASKPLDLVCAFDAATEETITPWYQATRTFDRHRLAEIDADLAGTPYRTPDPGWAMATALYAAALLDPGALRAQSEIGSMLAMPPAALATPGVLERVVALGANAPRYPGNAPHHDELVAAIAGTDVPRSARTPCAQPKLFVQDVGHGEPVLLLHGWPDDHSLWREQVAALTAEGYRTIAPDLRGFGASDKPADVSAYTLLKLVGDLVALLDGLGVRRAHVVGHDWGSAIGSSLAAIAPGRVASLTCLAVGHPRAFREAGWDQRQRSWYMLLFQFPGVAEQWLSQDDFTNLRAWLRHPRIESVVNRLRTPGALTASLGLYRAILPPQSLLGPPPPLPPIQAPTLGIWGSEDFAVTEQAMSGTERYVAGPWRYERMEGAGHWMQLDEPNRVNALLLDFLTEHKAAPAQAGIRVGSEVLG